MLLRDLDDVKRLFASLRGAFWGVGITAYSRITPGYLLNPYRIIALRHTRDLPLVRRKAPVFCLEEEMENGFDPEGCNSAFLLSHPMVRDHLAGKRDPKYILLYQSYGELERLAAREGWVLLANPETLRLRIGDRFFFQDMLGRLGLGGIPGGIHPIGLLDSRDYDHWARILGDTFVIRLPDIRQGGGRGTFFVPSREAYQRCQETLNYRLWRGIHLKRMAVHAYIEGMSLSLALCLTRHGVLFSGIQRQLIDLPYCEGMLEKGVFCGHSWGEVQWPAAVSSEIYRQADIMGTYLAGLGYRGIVGLDFLVDHDGGRVFPMECNPRLTGAFPMLSQLQLCEGIIPLDVFHWLEFMEIPYELDPAFMNGQYGRPLKGSHLILYNWPTGKCIQGGRLQGGLHEYDPKEEVVTFKGEAIDFSSIGDSRQFIIVEGPPDRNHGGQAVSDPLFRICRLLFPDPVLDSQDRLTSHAFGVVKKVYESVMP